MKIRTAMASDAIAFQAITRDELGYDFPLEKTRVQLEHLLASPGHLVLVAVTDTIPEHVIGIIHGAPYESFYGEPALNILALAVDKKYQGQGVGRKLLEEIALPAQQLGYTMIRLNSGSQRKGAHAFYEKVGYQRIKEQVVFHHSLIK